MEFAEFSIAFNKPIALDEALFSKFEEYSKMLGYTNTMVNKGVRTCFDDRGNQVTLNNQSFVFLLNKPSKDDLEKMGDDALSLLGELVQLDKNAKASMRFVELVNKTYDTFSKSREKLDFLASDVIGIGYRYFLNTDHGVSDFKAEPFIRNNNMWYFEATFNYTEFDELSKAKYFVENACIKFDENTQKFIDMLEREQ